MEKIIFKNIATVNESVIKVQDVLVSNGRIEKIGSNISISGNVKEISGDGKYLMPGVIDDQVHFREPGLTHKATIGSESRAAVAGGVTSFMEMPNTIPNTLTQELLEEKYSIANRNSIANYSFFLGVGNDNVEEVLKMNECKEDVCGIKIFMGSSTGNMLVNNPVTLEKIFSNSELLIATHCEDETRILNNYEKIKKAKPDLEPADHPIIRDAEACHLSSLYAVQLAKKFNSRLHILHISTQNELILFSNMMPLNEKRITTEVCVHHLHFTAEDYERFGYGIKCNPAIKESKHKTALWDALNDNRLDVIATDHAPHLWSEKLPPYEKAHAGLPLVQHSLSLMLYYESIGKISIERIAEKMSHAVATCFKIKDRGYIREGYFADLVVINKEQSYTVHKNNLHYKCGWSPLEGFSFPATIEQTYVNGVAVYENGMIHASQPGMRMKFN